MVTKRKGLNFSKNLQTGHSAFTKNKEEAKKYAKKVGGKVKPTKHTLRGMGYLIYK
jgi:hypothetical protein